MVRRLRTQTGLHQINAAVRLRLVSAELDLAITFCAIAAATSDRTRSERCLASAERAYASALNYLNGGLNPRQISEVQEKIVRLESLLAGFGRGIP